MINKEESQREKSRISFIKGITLVREGYTRDFHGNLIIEDKRYKTFYDGLHRVILQEEKLIH